MKYTVAEKYDHRCSVSSGYSVSTHVILAKKSAILSESSQITGHLS